MTAAQALELLHRSELLHDAQQVQQALDRMAAAIHEVIADADPTVLAVATGGLWCTFELSRRFAFAHRIDTVHLTRYQGARRGGQPVWLARPRLPLTGRTVLVVDDILDQGHTLRQLTTWLRQQGVARAFTAVLVDKPAARPAAHQVQADFRGLLVPGRYVFGCGMDLHEYWRGLPEIRALAPADEQATAALGGGGAAGA